MTSIEVFNKSNSKVDKTPLLPLIQSNVASTYASKLPPNTKSCIPEIPPVYQLRDLEQSFHASKKIDYYTADSMGIVGPPYPHLNGDFALDIPPFFRSIDLSDFAVLAKEPLFIFNPKQPNVAPRTECIRNKDGTKKILHDWYGHR